MQAYSSNTYLYSCIHVLIRVFGPRLNTEPYSVYRIQPYSAVFNRIQLYLARQ